MLYPTKDTRRKLGCCWKDLGFLLDNQTFSNRVSNTVKPFHSNDSAYCLRGRKKLFMHPNQQNCQQVVGNAISLKLADEEGFLYIQRPM